MITVFDIVTSPNFKNFQIISGEKGIQNPVSGTGIFDWESKSDIAKSFRKGEFVITTLSIAKDDFDYANDCIKDLILHGVSAICIKEVFFRNLSEDTIQKSDILGIPIFFFSDTFVDDIVYDVRNLMAADKGALRSNLTPAMKEALTSWYRTGSIPADKVSFIEENLHPYLQDFAKCVVAFPKNGKPLAPTMRPSKTDSGISSIFLPYESGVLALLSSPNGDRLQDKSCLGVLEAAGILASSCWIGGSTTLKGTRELAGGIIEAFLACASDMIQPVSDAEKQVNAISFFRADSVENLLISNCWTESSRQYFMRMNQILNTFDKEHGSDLQGTLRAYIDANGDLVVASKLLFQHANTVRYRVAKIKSLLEIDTPSSYLELFVFVKLMKIYEAFEMKFDIGK